MIRMTMMLTGVLVLASCGVGGGGDSTGSLHDDLARTRAHFIVLDPVSGTVTPMGAIPDLLDNPGWRRDVVVFRLVPGATTAIGAPEGEIGRQDDEALRTVHAPATYVAVFECTQAQWLLLTGTTPWQAGGSAPFGEGDDLPAYGLSFAQVSAALVTLSSRFAGSGRLDLPTAKEWEHAARAGGSAFSWGASTSATAVQAHAVVHETLAADGPSLVGGRSPNAFGLHDVHGNVWEFTAEGALRGGSWLDPVALARAANRQVVDAHTALPLAGVRLVWRPGR